MEELYEKYALRIYKYIYALSKNHDISEEILQETFYSALKNINKFNGDSSIYTWLCVIAKNKWRDYMRKNQKIKFIKLTDVESTEHLEYFNEDIEDKEIINSLYEQIYKLDNPTQEVMLLRINSNLSFKEIGKVYGKSEQWARTIFYRGKLKLKERLTYE